MQHFLHDGVADALREAASKTTVDIWDFKAFQTEMKDVNEEWDTVDFEFSRADALGYHAGEKILLVLVEALAHAFHGYDVAEKFCAEVSVSLHGFFYQI